MSWSIKTACAFLALFIAAEVPAPVFANCEVKKVVELPITMEGLRPTILVQFNGKDARLVLDSGAFFSMISGAMAAEYNLKLTPAPLGLRVTGVGGSTNTELTIVKSFGLIGITLHNVEFLVGGSDAAGSGFLGQTCSKNSTMNTISCTAPSACSYGWMRQVDPCVLGEPGDNLFGSRHQQDRS